jgi:hypothetical protein
MTKSGHHPGTQPGEEPFFSSSSKFTHITQQYRKTDRTNADRKSSKEAMDPAVVTTTTTTTHTVASTKTP